MPDYRLSSAAVADIREIRKHSKQRFGVEATTLYIHGLETMLDMLGERPSLGKGEAALGFEARSFRYKSHRIYYRVGVSVIEVLRILHQARDVTAVFAEKQ